MGDRGGLVMFVGGGERIICRECQDVLGVVVEGSCQGDRTVGVGGKGWNNLGRCWGEALHPARLYKGFVSEICLLSFRPLFNYPLGFLLLLVLSSFGCSIRVMSFDAFCLMIMYVFGVLFYFFLLLFVHLF